MNDDAQLDREFAYTPWNSSCRDVYGLDANGTEIVCRRPINHKDSCGSGFGARRVRWQKEEAA